MSVRARNAARPARPAKLSMPASCLGSRLQPATGNPVARQACGGSAAEHAQPHDADPPVGGLRRQGKAPARRPLLALEAVELAVMAERRQQHVSVMVRVSDGSTMRAIGTSGRPGWASRPSMPAPSERIARRFG